jgi:predicted aspartyl protease
MITGTISADLEPLLNDVFVLQADGMTIPVRTILDTGFNGWFCMPRKILEQMTVKPAGIVTYELGDGSELIERTYTGEVIVDNQPFVVELGVTDSDTALMGMAMLLEREAIFNLKDMTVKVV